MAKKNNILSKWKRRLAPRCCTIRKSCNIYGEHEINACGVFNADLNELAINIVNNRYCERCVCQREQITLVRPDESWIYTSDFFPLFVKGCLEDLGYNVTVIDD